MNTHKLLWAILGVSLLVLLLVLTVLFQQSRLLSADVYPQPPPSPQYPPSEGPPVPIPSPTPRGPDDPELLPSLCAFRRDLCYEQCARPGPPASACLAACDQEWDECMADISTP